MGRPKNFEPDVVIAQAMETFWTKGYAGTSPADLAEATGVAKGSLYHSFGSKRELFTKALDLYGRLGSEATEEFLARPGTAKERIRAYLVLLVDTDLDGPVRRGCLAQNTVEELGGRDEEATRKVHRIEERMVELFAARIEQGQRDGDVDRDVDARAQALFVQTTLAGLRVMAKTFDRPVLLQIVDTALARL
ncbi:TetR/AcrR family transcriptional regulator [Streptomyces sp. SP17BM10]|uniref:TetR/AcrR family transcriptional regulator n=1 Tax=Streptomyces sp. SP17BM10 TaxID=3002530 RepID=UPI002E7767EB|nr:TetR/AcrR family transcriptional regulator [Streptomyces sp. SP17BM10]MEE1785036.1 TetR/AcrR family transcriptional regulator [Streptomyces sp. SP17BM10]